jgi:hypothetical protein
MGKAKVSETILKPSEQEVTQKTEEEEVEWPNEEEKFQIVELNASDRVFKEVRHKAYLALGFYIA